MPLVPYKDSSPRIGKDCFIAPNAWITGDTTLGDNVSVFFAAAIRGDIEAVFVGSSSNIQEHALLHTSKGLGDCVVGAGVVVGHRAIIHGATVGDHSLIGMGATILDGAKIGKHSMVGANSLVTMNTEIPEGVLAVGSPAKVIRELRPEEIAGIKEAAAEYVLTGAEYRKYFSTE